MENQFSTSVTYFFFHSFFDIITGKKSYSTRMNESLDAFKT